MEQIQKTKSGAIWVYGLCLLSFGLLFGMNTSYWAYFMTDIAQMPAAVMAKTLLVANVCDWIMVIVAAIIIQKTYPRIKYRTWVLVGPIVVAICFSIMFMPTNLSVTGKAFLYGGAYCFQTVFMSLMWGGINTLVPLLGKRQEDRAAFSARKAQGNQLGKVIFGFITLPLILLINGGEKAVGTGFFVMTIFYALIFVAAFTIMWRFAKDADEEALLLREEERPPILEMFKTFFTNQHLISAILADSTRYVAQFVVWGLAVYYFRYAMGHMEMMTVFLTTMSIIGFFGAIFGEFLARKIDKRTVFMLGMGVLAIAHLISYFIAKDAMTFIIIISIGYFGVSWANANAIALQSDATVYSEWKTGKEVKGFLMGMGQLVPKMANIVVAIVIGYGLTTIGYVANVDMSPEAISGLNKLINLVPAGFLVLGILLIFFLNKLTVSKMKEIQADLQARKSVAK